MELHLSHRVPTYRRRMFGKVKADVRDAITQLWEYETVEIVEGSGC